MNARFGALPSSAVRVRYGGVKRLNIHNVDHWRLLLNICDWFAQLYVPRLFCISREICGSDPPS